jgi:hypothetical protein
MRHAHKKHKASQLLDILTAVREPDMSFPVGVEGVAAESVIVPPRTADDKRERHTRELIVRKRTEYMATMTARRTLAKNLSLGEVRTSAQRWLYALLLNPSHVTCLLLIAPHAA